VMVMGALDLAAKQTAEAAPPFPQQGGWLILKYGDKELRFEITDATYGIVYREEEDDIIEFCGEDLSFSAVVPRGLLTVAAKARNFAPLAGVELQLRCHSSCFDAPFIVLPGSGRLEVVGGKLVIETAESLIPPFGAGGKRPAAGRLTASIEIVVKEQGYRVMYFGRLDLAFSL